MKGEPMMNNIDIGSPGREEASKGTKCLGGMAMKTEKEAPSFLSDHASKDFMGTWRRVEDELPHRNEVVLVCFRNQYDSSLTRAMAYRTFDNGISRWSTDLIYEEPNAYTIDEIEVTHWLPLPKLPPT
jgi:hypothetical protein